MEPTQTQASSSAGDSTRIKMWSELTDSEKIERMRTHVKYLESTIERQAVLIYKLFNHFHTKDGQLASKLDHFEPIAGGRNIPVDENSFF